MLPTCVIVPVYQKIRLSFDVVMGWLARVHKLFMMVSLVQRDRVEWDVFICETKDYKREVSAMSLADNRKRGLLLSSQPRFIWRMIFSIDGTPAAELLLDATSFSTAAAVFAVNWFDAALADRARLVVETGKVDRLLTRHLVALLLSEVVNRTTDTIGVAPLPTP